MQVDPAAQVPVPVQPMPPHCEYFGRVPPGADAVGVLDVVVVVDVTGRTVVDVVEEAGGAEVPGPAPPV